jgi:hypothetical protein
VRAHSRRSDADTEQTLVSNFSDLTDIKADDTTVWPMGYPRDPHSESPDTAITAPALDFIERIDAPG